MSTNIDTSHWTYMAGTEGTGKYLVLARSSVGRLGIRPLGNGRVRIRIEPNDGHSATFENILDSYWKRPDKQQNRYSLVVPDCMDGAVMVRIAIRALKKGTDFELNGKNRLWRFKHFSSLK